MALQDSDVFDRLERFYDAVPRPDARAEEFGALVLFVREGPGWPFYARPVPGAPAPSAADITAVRQRQRDLGVPEAFEWVHETNPDLLAVARSANLAVLLAPLLVLEPAALVPDLPVTGGRIRLLDPAQPSYPTDLAASRAVASLGFAAPAAATPVQALTGGLITEPAGPRERDAMPVPPPEAVDAAGERTRAGRLVTAVVEAPEGILATGVCQRVAGVAGGAQAVRMAGTDRVAGVAEIAGVATLPSARRRGYASQLTATLARNALRNGADLVFLSAGDDEVARLYSRVGFRRVGTACIAQPAPAAL